MKLYKFTEIAEHDLSQIVDYTRNRWGSGKALEYIDGLEKIVQRLAVNPDIGIKRDGIRKNILIFPYISHVICYERQEYGIVVVRVLHKNMSLELSNFPIGY
ncbi:MAG: type II toxin-antitoxin system RelE/ParE family toxin [Rickettsiales bacterium]